MQSVNFFSGKYANFARKINPLCTYPVLSTLRSASSHFLAHTLNAKLLNSLYPTRILFLLHGLYDSYVDIDLVFNKLE